MAKQEEECEVCEDWMGTYGDMVTLLLCFFVMLCNASKVDVVLFEQIQASMNKVLGDKEIQRPLQILAADLADDIQSMDAGDEVALGSDTQGLVLELASASFFDAGSAKLREEALPILKRIAGTLKAERYKKFAFKVEGHTDDIPIKTEMFPSNWELSAARASSMVRFLIERGIEPTRLQAIGFADIAPKYPNKDPNGEAIPANMEKNRRVVVHIEPFGQSSY